MAFVLPPLLTDTLDAVNTVLQVIGEAPVNTVVNSESVDVADALNAINEQSRALQSEGWHWNEEIDLKLIPNNADQIPLPSNCLHVNHAYWSVSGSRLPALISERARKLYNGDTHSYTFTDPVYVDMLVILDFEEMPEYARRYVTIVAAQQFQARKQGEQIVNAVTEEQVIRARATLEQREDAAKPQNSITGNPNTARIVYGSNGPRRKI